MDRQRKSYPEFWYKDSAKVLTDILGLLADHREALVTLPVGGPIDAVVYNAGEVSKIHETCIRLITEEIENAPKTIHVPAKTQA